MSHSEKCPICHGTGGKEGKPTDEGPRDCHGCDGKGWVTVEDHTESVDVKFVTN